MEGLLELERCPGPAWLGSGADALGLSPPAGTPLPYDVKALELAGKRS